MKEENIAALMAGRGEDPQREGLRKTPARFLKSFQELTSGYEKDPGELLSQALFQESYKDMVLVKDIEFYSLCEHHLLPFYGVCHIAYIPQGRVLGLSKLPRLVDIFARRLQLQERMTRQICGALMEHLQPLGAAVFVEAQHLCLMMRGVQKQNSVTTTSGFRGQFEKIETRNEFLKLISSDLS